MDALIGHLWEFASIRSPQEFAQWDSDLDAVSLIEYQTLLKDDIRCCIPQELHGDFSSLVSNVQNIGMCDAYGASTDRPIDMLLQIFSLLEKHKVSIPPLDVFASSNRNNGWSLPVDSALLESWRMLDVP